MEENDGLSATTINMVSVFDRGPIKNYKHCFFSLDCQENPWDQDCI